MGQPKVAWDFALAYHHQRRCAGAHRQCKVRLLEFGEADLGHGFEHQLPLLDFALLESAQPFLHVIEPRTKAGLKGLIDQGRPNDFSDQLVKVGNTLERVSNGFGVSIGERSEQPLAKDSVALDLEF